MKQAPLTAILKADRESVIAQGHPWVFTGAVARYSGAQTTGTVTDVIARDGTWLARGLYHAGAVLCIRLYSWTAETALDEQLFFHRIRQACRLREVLFSGTMEQTNAFRLVFSEADGISGLIVDRYADVLSIQVASAALVPYLDPMVEELKRVTGLRKIWLRADRDAVQREGLDAALVESKSTLEACPVPVRQDGLHFEVDPRGGQKTGFYLDQRMNRHRVALYAAGRRVLSAYCYTGAFEVYVARAGASHITGLDSSEGALRQAERHHALNQLAIPLDYQKSDVPNALRRFRDERKSFDLVILDPPRFVANRAQKEKGMAAYKDINLLAIKLLAPEGILATFSCSGLVSMDDLIMAVKWAAVDAGRTVRICELLGQPPDHPVIPPFQESHYLKGLICWVE